MVKDQYPRRRRGNHIGRTGLSIQQRNLTEVVAGSHAIERLTALADLRGAFQEQHEIVTGVALADQHVARIDPDVLAVPSDGQQVVIADVRQQRDGAQQARLVDRGELIVQERVGAALSGHYSPPDCPSTVPSSYAPPGE